MTPRKLNALVFMVVGMLLLVSVEPLNKAFAGANSLLLAAINFLVLPALILFALGIYRFAECWRDINSRLRVIPGKEALSAFSQHLQEKYSVSVTPTAIVDAMEADEIPADIKRLTRDLSRFALSKLK